MKIDFKKIFLFTITLFLLPFSKDVFANQLLLERTSYNYVIDSYDINLIVNENNTFDVEEKITVFFNLPRHGIKREIPLKNNVTRLDGTKSSNRARITNLEVSDNYKVSKSNGNTIIKIGDEDNTIRGTKTYVIKYKYNIGKDPLKDKDELYFNLIGSSWDTIINNITFTITMPKEFDQSKLGFSYGGFGSTATEAISYQVSGNKVTGNLNKTLYPNQSLSVRCELVEGYFKGKAVRSEPVKYLVIIVPILFTIISYAFWYKYGRDDEVIETVEFYPPNGLNSLEIGYLYKGKAENYDITSLLVYLANKGYIKIMEFKENNSTNFKIIKLKEYDENDENERIFFNGLFKDKTEVTFADLYNKFYKTAKEITHRVEKENKNKVFESATTKMSFLVNAFKIITLLLITIPPIYEYGEIATTIFALVIPYIIFNYLYTMISNLVTNKKHSNDSVIAFIIMAVFMIIFVSIPLKTFIIPAIICEEAYLVGYIIGYIVIALLNICIKILPKRTKYGNEMLGKIRGFKNFLETAEKDRLEAMVMENPKYFYDILPYAYVLDVSDKWIERFETITLQEPDWYDSPNTFSINTFDSFITSTLSEANSAMSSSPSSSDSSSGSGGGVSGGGSGGGGGSSW